MLLEVIKVAAALLALSFAAVVFAIGVRFVTTKNDRYETNRRLVGANKTALARLRIILLGQLPATQSDHLSGRIASGMVVSRRHKKKYEAGRLTDTAIDSAL